MAEDVGELGDVFLYAVERAGEKMPEVMRKHFARVDVCFLAELLHLTPDIRAADGFTVLGNENCTVIYAVTLCIFQQLFLQTADDDDRPSLALAVDGCKSPLRRFDGNKLQLTYTYPRTANRLENE